MTRSHVATRGRPRTFDTDEVLAEALEVFWRRGIRATTIRDLEAHLGLSQSSLYNTFGTKTQLLDAALDRYEVLVDRDLLQPLEAAAAGLDSVLRFFDALGRWVSGRGRRGCMIVNLMAEDGGEIEGISRRTRRYRARVRSAIKAALDRAAAAGELDPEVADGRADVLLGLALGLNVAARGGATSAELTRLVTAAQALVQTWRRA